MLFAMLIHKLRHQSSVPESGMREKDDGQAAKEIKGTRKRIHERGRKQREGEE